MDKEEKEEGGGVKRKPVIEEELPKSLPRKGNRKEIHGRGKI